MALVKIVSLITKNAKINGSTTTTGDSQAKIGKTYKKKALIIPKFDSLSMKILSISTFTTKLLSKLLSVLYIGVHLKGTIVILSI